MSEENSKGVFTSFMKEQNVSKSESAAIIKENQTKQSLKEAKEKKEEEKKKELTEAKKNSAFKASRYNQAGMKKAQAKGLIILIPFLALGAFLVIMLVMNSGKIVSGLFNSITKAMIK